MGQINQGVGSQGPKVFYDRQNKIRAIVRLAFSFAVNGSSSPVAATLNGRGVTSVVRASTGLYTVTLIDYWNQMISAKAHLQLNTPAAEAARILGAVNLNPASGGGLTFQVLTYNTDTDAATDVAATTGNLVNVVLEVSNSSFAEAV